jgi:arylsulfatase A-like enzyme
MPRLRQDRPNVLVFFTDQQRWDSAGIHGNPLDLTPNFDRMALEGAHAYHAFTPQPVCGPARAVLQTGRYATQVGCWRNGLPLPRDARTLAHCFRDAGYTTGYIGKWHLAGGPAAVPPEERGGYQYWLGANALEHTSDSYRAEMYDGEGRKVLLPGYRVDALTDAAIRYLDAHQREPFFLFLSFLEPHFQNSRDDYPPPDGYRERYTGRWTPPDLAALGGSAPQHLGGYWGMVKRLDEAFGRLLDALKSLRLSEDTIVAFTADHGCHFKTRNSEYKRSCHESSIRIPLAFRGPNFQGRGRIQELISLLDVPPSLLDAAGLPIPKEMSGRSILPLLRGRRDGWPEEVFIQISESQVARAVRTRRWTYSVSAPDGDGLKDARADRYVEEFLYDLEADPHQLTNLAGHDSHGEVRAVLRERLLRCLAAAGEPRPEILPAAKTQRGGQRQVSSEEARI